MSPSDSDNVGIAFGLVIGAGASTGVGAAVVFFPVLLKLANRKTLAAGLGFSAGAMSYVAFAEIFNKSHDSFLDSGFSEDDAVLYSTLTFFAGIAIMLILNWFVTFFLSGHGKRGKHSDTAKDARTNEISGASNGISASNLYANEQPLPADGKALPCPCSDINPADTLVKIQHMGESMAHHPGQAHVEKEEKVFLEDETHNNIITDSNKTDRDNNDGPPETLDLEFNAKDEANNNQNDEPSEFGNQIDDESDDESEEDEAQSNEELYMTSMKTALAIALHNFPEGLATFVTALDDPAVGALLAISIAIHNIPEGLCVAMPIYYATGSRWRAFGWALMSGTSEPIAAFLGWLFLYRTFSDKLYACMFGIVAGMMVIISFREMLPTAHRYDPDDSVVTYSFIAGMFVIALSLILQ